MNKFIQNYLSLLKKKNFTYPELELRLLLNYASLEKEQIFLSNFNIKKINVTKFKTIFNRRIQKEPFSKIVKSKEFWSYNFYVNQSVLDPRPETEFLIEAVIKRFKNKNKKITICDLGTGSGCISISLAKIFINSKITATDISNEAIKVAKKNAMNNQVIKQIEFLNCNWLKKYDKYDLVVSNPPYLTKEEYDKSDNSIKKFEPRKALLGGKDGLSSYREIASFSNNIMHSNSFLIIEFGKDQTNKISNIFKQYGLKIIEIIKDYQCIDRIMVLKLNTHNKKNY